VDPSSLYQITTTNQGTLHQSSHNELLVAGICVPTAAILCVCGRSTI